MDDDDPPIKRAMFSKFPLWVTPQRDDEIWASGNLVYQSNGAVDGLAVWTASDRSLVDEDLVAWYTIGIHHVTRQEDGPVMPTLTQFFDIVPENFFRDNPAMVIPPDQSRPSSYWLLLGLVICTYARVHNTHTRAHVIGGVVKSFSFPRQPFLCGFQDLEPHTYRPAESAAAQPALTQTRDLFGVHRGPLPCTVSIILNRSRDFSQQKFCRKSRAALNCTVVDVAAAAKDGSKLQLGYAYYTSSSFHFRSVQRLLLLITHQLRRSGPVVLIATKRMKFVSVLLQLLGLSLLLLFPVSVRRFVIAHRE